MKFWRTIISAAAAASLVAVSASAEYGGSGVTRPSLDTIDNGPGLRHLADNAALSASLLGPGAVAMRDAYLNSGGVSVASPQLRYTLTSGVCSLTAFVGTGSITNGTLTITHLTSGALKPGLPISGGVIQPGTVVTVGVGGVGTYTVNIPQNVKTTTITAAGDGASQVPSSNGNCWSATFPDGGVDPRLFGAIGNGTTDDTVAYNAAAAFAFNSGTILDLPGLQFGVTAVFGYANSKTIWEPGACLVQLGDGHATYATLPSPGAVPGPSPGIVLDHPCVHVNGHLSAAFLAEQATSIEMIAPQWDGLPTAVCTFTHDDGVNAVGTYPCGGILLKGITGVTGPSQNFGPYYWHITDAVSRMPFGTVTVAAIGPSSFTFTGTTCASNCSNHDTPPLMGIGNGVGDLTDPGGQIPKGTTVTGVSAQVNGTVTLSGPHTIQIGDVVEFTTSPNPAIWTGTTAGQTGTTPNFGVLDGRSVFKGYHLSIWNCSGSDNKYIADWSESMIGFENGGCGIDVQRTRIEHPYMEDNAIYGIWNTVDGNQTGHYDSGLRIVDNYAGAGGTFTPLFDEGLRTSVQSSLPQPRPNLLTNGSFEFDQANGANALTLASGVTSPGPDAWETAFANAAGGTFTATRLAEGANPGYRFWRLKDTAPGTVVAGSSLAMWNVATGDEIADANFGGRGQSICQSFLAESSLSGTFAAYVMNAAGTRAYAWPFTLTGGAAAKVVSNCFRPDTPDSFGATASITLTVMNVTVLNDPVDNQILPGTVVSGSGVTAGTTVVAQLSGTPFGVGTYTVSPSQSVSSEVVTISSPWNSNGPQRSLLAGVMAAAGTTNQITPGAWTTIPQLVQGVGVSGQSTDMLTTNGATLDISEMKIEIGDQPTDYVHHSYPVALGLVRQRYWKTFPLTKAPAQNAGITDARCQKAASATAGSWSMTVGPDQPMLTNSAIITTYNPSAANANIRDVDAGTDAIVDPDPSSAIGFSGVEIAEKTTALNIADNYCIHVTIDRRP